jgi:two-component SAPR family response regulator
VPLLIRARQQGLRPKYAGRLLSELGLDMALDFHPGYSLRVHTLGQFDISRGSEPIADADWQREKSRRLFQALLTHRGRFVQRGELAAWLWPEADEPSSQRLFKVTLNAMHEALERGRAPRAATVFVQRRGSSYGINPSAPLWHDATAFESLLRQADAARETPQAITLYRRALDLYRGDYLPECLYEDWSSAERERLRQLRLRALTSLAERLLQLGDWASAIEACQQALEQDPCMESACRLRIRAHLAAGDKVEAQRAYDRCVTALREELGVSPAPETLSLLEEIRALD